MADSPDLPKPLPPPGPTPCRIDASVVQQIKQWIGETRAEQGGMLGGSLEDGVVRHFHFDRTARRTGATYSPNHVDLNRLLKKKWKPAGIRMLGFVHSHPAGYREPSAVDLAYVEALLAHNDQLTSLLLVIAMTTPDTGHFELLAFRAVRRGTDIHVEEVHMIVESSAVVTQVAELAAPAAMSQTFQRVQQAYDLPRLAASQAIVVGLGGGVGFVEDLARTGVRSYVLIDPDVVTETNLATQQVYRRDLGRPKVACIAERIHDINPDAETIPLHQSLDELDDEEFENFVVRQGVGQPAVTLLCGFTDNFATQARVNRLALHFGLPSLCAQLYKEGRAAEISFTHPKATSACHRCMLLPRYRAFLEGGFTNNVTSDGTPIFATSRVNALKGFIALALLHHGHLSMTVGEDGPIPSPALFRWGTLLSRIGNRTLVQLRLDPDLRTTLGMRVFDRVFDGAAGDRLLFDEAIWLPQQPEHGLNGRPACPDCGGTGDLRDAIGTFTDTRIMRQ